MNIDVTNLNEYSLQQIFDFVIGKLLEQGKPAMKILQGKSLLECAYRGDGGTKCAAGQLIPDELYEVSMEGTAITEIAYRYEWSFKKDHSQLIRALQLAHDNAAYAGRTVGTGDLNSVDKVNFVSNFRHNARRVAAEFELSTNILDGIQSN